MRFRKIVLACLLAILILAIILLAQGIDSGRIIPLLLAGIVIVIAVIFGPRPALITGLASATLLALFLYPPVGSLAIEDAGIRRNVMWLLLAATAGAALFGT